MEQYERAWALTRSSPRRLLGLHEYSGRTGEHSQLHPCINPEHSMQQHIRAIGHVLGVGKLPG